MVKEVSELEHVEEKNGWIAAAWALGAPRRKVFKSTSVFLLLLKTENL